MALNTLKCSYLTALGLKGLTEVPLYYSVRVLLQEQIVVK